MKTHGREIIEVVTDLQCNDNCAGESATRLKSH